VRVALHLCALVEARRLELLPATVAGALDRALADPLPGAFAELQQRLAEAQAALGPGDVRWSLEPALAVGALPRVLAAARDEPSPREAAACLGRLCEDLLARGERRRASGSYYTPAWLAEEIARTAVRGVLEGRGAGGGGALALRVLDPAAGAGAFLVAALEAIVEAVGGQPEQARLAAAESCLFAIERDPLAAEACRLAVWLAASCPGRPARLPAGRIAAADALASPPSPRSFDIVLGNPPWGVEVSLGGLAGRIPPPLAGQRDACLFFVHLAAEAARDGGAIGLLVPDSLLSQVRYEPLRRAVLARFRPLRIALLGDRLFPGAVAPAALVCLADRAIAPARFPFGDLRRVRRAALPGALAAPAPLARSDAPVAAPHHSLVVPPEWLRALLTRLQADLTSLGAQARFVFHDVGVNYSSSAAGRAIIYEGRRQGPGDIALTRGRDFGALTEIGSSAWLRGDWPARVPPGARVAVRERVYRRAPKLLVRQTGDRPVATLDRRGVWFGRSVIAITAPEEWDLLALAAVLNSRAAAALYRAVAPEAGRPFAQVKVSKLRLLPLPPRVSWPALAGCAARLLDENGPARRRALLEEMDRAVCRAYGLAARAAAEIEAAVTLAPAATRPPRGATV